MERPHPDYAMIADAHAGKSVETQNAITEGVSYHDGGVFNQYSSPTHDNHKDAEENDDNADEDEFILVEQEEAVTEEVNHETKADGDNVQRREREIEDRDLIKGAILLSDEQ